MIPVVPRFTILFFVVCIVVVLKEKAIGWRVGDNTTAVCPSGLTLNYEAVFECSTTGQWSPKYTPSERTRSQM